MARLLLVCCFDGDERCKGPLRATENRPDFCFFGALQLFVRDKNWAKQPDLKCLDAGVPDIITDYMKENRHLKIVDFEEHLENVTK
jgi:hypothetical protein